MNSANNGKTGTNEVEMKFLFEEHMQFLQIIIIIIMADEWRPFKLQYY